MVQRWHAAAVLERMCRIMPGRFHSLPPMRSNPPESPILVACLCAAWCDTCDDYRRVFESEAAQRAGQVEFRWIDIEDEAALVGDVEVENFPTLVIAQNGRAQFYGTITPHARTLTRLVDAALANELTPVETDEVRDFARRLVLSSS